MRTAAIVLMSIMGLWLFSDSLTFALYPPDRVTGRAGGCYTTIERVLGFMQPSDGFRQTQSLTGGTLAFGVPMAFAIRRRAIRRAR